MAGSFLALLAIPRSSIWPKDAILRSPLAAGRKVRSRSMLTASLKVLLLHLVLSCRGLLDIFPALLHSNPKSVLGIGFGAGVSAGTFTRYPSIQNITICEIEPLIPPTSTRYFARQNYSVYKNPKTRVVFDDARHYLMTTRETFDIIASDPLDVFVKGTAALYSKEYFEAVKRHLNPGGMFTLYVPLYESDVRTVQSELATFFDAFPHSTIWANTREGRGYDMVFMG